MNNYKEINRQAWNIKTAIHIDSDFYDNDSFLKGRNTLNSIELDMLGDIHGKSILHLQCHFGQDSISLARMGAEVTAVDLSEKAIENARIFSKQLGFDVNFICSDIYDLPEILDQKFDIVFTSYGVIGWLPDLDSWAQLISSYLKPHGKFVFVEFHPLVWIFDEDFRKIAYDYFDTGEIIETFAGTYADRNADISYSEISWNHPLSDVLNSLIGVGIEIKKFDEFDYSPYPCFKNIVEFAKGKYRISHLEHNIPMVYSLLGEKK